MCQVCIDWEKGKLKAYEAFRAIGEMLSSTNDEETQEHLIDLSSKILDHELPDEQEDGWEDEDWVYDGYDGDPYDN